MFLLFAIFLTYALGQRAEKRNEVALGIRYTSREETENFAGQSYWDAQTEGFLQSCPEGRDFTGAGPCKKWAEYQRRKYERQFRTPRSNWPKGCTLNGNYVYFNSHATGSRNDDVEVVCYRYLEERATRAPAVTANDVFTTIGNGHCVDDQNRRPAHCWGSIGDKAYCERLCAGDQSCVAYEHGQNYGGILCQLIYFTLPSSCPDTRMNRGISQGGNAVTRTFHNTGGSCHKKTNKEEQNSLLEINRALKKALKTALN